MHALFLDKALRLSQLPLLHLALSLHCNNTQLPLLPEFSLAPMANFPVDLAPYIPAEFGVKKGGEGWTPRAIINLLGDPIQAHEFVIVVYEDGVLQPNETWFIGMVLRAFSCSSDCLSIGHDPCSTLD
jgi:hypothetical protein